MAQQTQVGDVKMRLPTAVRRGEVFELKVKIKHPSRTGLSLKEDAPTPYQRFRRERPAEYVKLVEVYYGDERVCWFEVNSSTSDDPLLAIKIRADKAGPIRVVFTNHKDQKFEGKGEVVLS